MIVAVCKEPLFESRVSLLPETAAALVKKNISVWIESDAGAKASCSNQDYLQAGCQIGTRDNIIVRSQVILTLQYQDIPSNLGTKVLIGIYQPLYQIQLIEKWAKQQLTVFSLDMLPRTTRAQSMDVLSSQASIAGYKAVLLAANLFQRYFPMLMTAAGTIPPARVLILGAGVAGLQAIATAKRLGAMVEVFDTRPAVKEEVMSLGAKFIEVEGAANADAAGGYAVEQQEDFLIKQKAKIADSLAKADILITTAQIPGKQAPVLVTLAMLESMKKGSVVVDLAAATGGNTELTQNDKTVIHQGVTIVGNSSLAASLPYDASKLYGKNVSNFLQLITGSDHALNLNFEDDIVKGCCIVHGGEIINPRVKAQVAAG